MIGQEAEGRADQLPQRLGQQAGAYQEYQGEPNFQRDEGAANSASAATGGLATSPTFRLPFKLAPRLEKTGASPKSTPAARETASAKKHDWPVERNSSLRGFLPRRQRVARRTRREVSEPATRTSVLRRLPGQSCRQARRAASFRSAVERTIRSLDAPSACRSATSRWRLVARDSSRLATLRQAISSSTAEAASSTRSAGRRSP